VLWTVATMVLNVVKSFLNGYLIACVMLIIAPLFMPLIFLKVTTDYFDKWWKAILGGIMLPIIVTAYSMFALQVYDEILFKPESKLKVLFSDDRMKGAVQHSTAKCDLNVTSDPAFKDDSKGADPLALNNALDKLMKNPFIQNFVMPTLTGGSNACALFNAPTIDITKVKADGFDNPKAVMTKIFRDSLQLFIMAFLISAGVNTVEGTMAHLTAGSGLGARAMAARSETETKIATEFGNLQKNMAAELKKSDGTKLKDATGSNFIENLPKATKGAAGKFLTGLAGKRDK